MIDGSSYYSQQSTARKIHTVEDVRRHAQAESIVYERLILPDLPIDLQSHIYEAATGPGILQCWLTDRGFSNVLGSDFSENESRLAHQINASVVHGDSLEDLRGRCPAESLDVIIALDFYEHLPRESFREFLTLAHSRLRRGGVLILRGPNGDSPFVGLNLYNDITHVWAYTTVCLNALATIAGFSRVAFKDDTEGALHKGWWWKRWPMAISRFLLSEICRIATRQRVRLWGASLYIYAHKN